MVPPGDIFGIIPVWIGVYLALIATQALAGWLAYKRVIHLIRQGRSVARFDQPWKRLTGAVAIVVGQRKVLQRVGTEVRRQLPPGAYLALHVSVDPNWQDRPGAVERYCN